MIYVNDFKIARDFGLMNDLELAIDLGLCLFPNWTLVSELRILN